MGLFLTILALVINALLIVLTLIAVFSKDDFDGSDYRHYQFAIIFFIINIFALLYGGHVIQ